MAISLASIKNELLPGLRGVIGKYRDFPAVYPHIFKTYKSEMALERTTMMRFLPLAQVKTEGAATTMDDNAGERFVYNQEHLEVALGYRITRKAIDDNLYKRQFDPSNLGLQRSFLQFKEIQAANVFNLGSTYNPAVFGDGVSLFNTQHPIDGGYNSNTASTAVDLNEASLLNAMVQISSTYRDQAGLLINARAEKLLIPPALEPVAARLTKTALRPGTADNDVNVIPIVAGGLPGGYVRNVYLTSQFAWFLLTDQDGLAYMERIPFEMDMEVDFLTDNLMVKAYERYSFNYFDPLSAWGTFPTS